MLKHCNIFNTFYHAPRSLDILQYPDLPIKCLKVLLHQRFVIYADVIVNGFTAIAYDIS